MRGVDEEEEKAKAAKKGKKSLDKKKEAKTDESGETPGETTTEGESKKEGVDGEQEGEEAAAKPAEDEWQPYFPEVPSRIHWAQYSSPDTFWLSMDNYDAGYLYECRFLDEAARAKMAAEKIDEPFRAVAVVGSDITHSEDIPLTCFLFKLVILFETFCLSIYFSLCLFKFVGNS